MERKILKLKKKEYNFITKLIILTVFIIICLLIYKISNILIILWLALFLNILFSPLLNRFNKWKISDWIWITLIYVSILLMLFILIFVITPIFIKQFTYYKKNI